MNRKDFVVKWQMAGAPVLANVTIRTTSLYNASRSANTEAKQLGVTKTPRTIQLNGKVIEELDTGLSKYARYKIRH